MNTNLTAPGQKNLTALQAKLHYLKIISELPSYGAKCFSTTLSVSTYLSSPNIRNQSSHAFFAHYTSDSKADKVTKKKQTFSVIDLYLSRRIYFLKVPQKTQCLKNCYWYPKIFCESNVMHGMNGIWIPFCNIGNLHWCHKTACWMRTLQRVLPIIQRHRDRYIRTTLRTLAISLGTKRKNERTAF